MWYLEAGKDFDLSKIETYIYAGDCPQDEMGNYLEEGEMSWLYDHSEGCNFDNRRPEDRLIVLRDQNSDFFYMSIHSQDRPIKLTNAQVKQYLPDVWRTVITTHSEMFQIDANCNWEEFNPAWLGEYIFAGQSPEQDRRGYELEEDEKSWLYEHKTDSSLKIELFFEIRNYQPQFLFYPDRHPGGGIISLEELKEHFPSVWLSWLTMLERQLV